MANHTSSATGPLSIRLGVDIGGTFTDVVIENNGVQHSCKVLTTPRAPEEGIVSGLRGACETAGIKPSDIQQIIHGTTLATNALIERRGAKTALITTSGFRDVIEMRTESRFEQYDLNLTLPKPLLPRYQRYTLNERLAADGEVLLPLQASEVEAMADTIAKAGYESVAIGLIHSYVDPRHEMMVRDILLQRLPQLSISLSSEVSPQMREYERFNTVVANAYIKPLMKSYLDRLAERLSREGVSCPVFMMHSGGGIISLQSAAEFPVRLVESGPAGGAVFAAHIAARYGLSNVLSFDMGGTTAKICLIKDSTPKTSRVFEVARSYRFKKGSGMPISIPVIDMVEIGAGGGSLAHVDALKQIRVGPHSAGSEPGPACYARGGEGAAVTDADLLLGKLDADNFAGGSIVLDSLASEKALQRQVGEALDMDPQAAAFGVSEVVDENMANAARVHAVENGEDLAGYTMIAFGGAAPLHAGRLCEKLGIDRCLIPPGAGVGSAIGFLRAPFSFEASRSLFMRLSDFQPQLIGELLDELQREAREFVLQCAADSDIEYERKVYMRYSGQGWEIPVQLTSDDTQNPSSDRFQSLFEAAYQKLFSRSVQGMDIEITVWSVNAATRGEVVQRVDAAASGEVINSTGTRTLFDPSINEYVVSAEVARSEIKAGQHVAGPAVITESETSVIVPSGRAAIVQSDGCIDVLRGENA